MFIAVSEPILVVVPEIEWAPMPILTVCVCSLVTILIDCITIQFQAIQETLVLIQ